ncbi:ricin-type beta-trefoil lectin domain protein [Streptomyces sp. NPDC017082]|uniref:ricin-type beta-trefoil lectin domain protein n=1 Tax=Streptomyces sp. NPDC017082 TaxID=3364974 RepID=UPI0037A232A1
MAHVLRKLLIPGLLALTSSALPAVAVAAPAPPGTLPAVGKMCLESNYPSTYIVSVKGCNSSVAGQHWALSGEALYQTQYPNMCLESNYPSTYIVSVKGCNSSVAGQHWTVQGQQISETLF